MTKLTSGSSSGIKGRDSSSQSSSGKRKRSTKASFVNEDNNENKNSMNVPLQRQSKRIRK
jgi:hypothetical protein